MSEVVLRCAGLSREFVDAGRRLEVLQGVNLELHAGESVAIIGQSGSGKSTLLQLLAGLDKPSAGQVWIQDQELNSLGDAARTRLRNQHLGFVYQFHHLLPEFSALENAAMPLALGGAQWSLARSTAAEVLTAVGLGERLEHRPAELSGGERQRVAVARALVNQPACVLADEPTGNLDQATGHTVFEVLLDLQRRLATALVLVTHDRELAARADRCLELRQGQLFPVTTGS
nr:ATP-binding cassette domain-containing protein [Oceanococcus sp. HetDA_MAG_MS8]